MCFFQILRHCQLHWYIYYIYVTLLEMSALIYRGHTTRSKATAFSVLYFYCVVSLVVLSCSVCALMNL